MDSDLYTYPGITKNLTKTMCGKLKRFIKKQLINQPEVQDDPNVKEFLKATQDYKVANLNLLKQSQIGKEIVNFFFGNLIWCTDTNELNKLDINYYFQFNHLWYNDAEEEQVQKIEVSKQQENQVGQQNKEIQQQQQQIQTNLDKKNLKEENYYEDYQVFDVTQKKQKLE